MKFRKKPVVIDADIWNSNDENSMDFAKLHRFMIINGCLVIPTLEGGMFANPGDWIIRGVKGEYYSCRPDIFEATYEAVKETPNG